MRLSNRGDQRSLSFSSISNLIATATGKKKISTRKYNTGSTRFSFEKKKKNNNVYTYLSSRKFSFRENNLDSLVNPIGWISRRYRIAQFQVTGRCYCSSIENATHDCSRPSHSRIPINSSDIVFVVVFTRSEMEQRCAKVGTVVRK